MASTSSDERMAIDVGKKVNATIREAEENVEDEDILAIAIHPATASLFKAVADLDSDRNLCGIAGINNVLETENVDGFRVVVCNEKL